MHKMRFQILTLVLFTIFFLNSCREVKKTREAHLNQVSGPYSHLDPQLVTGLSATLILAKVYEPLYEVNPYDSPYKLRPLLAKTMPQVSKDGTTYEITLKSGVFYHNCPCFKGIKREVIAEDFVNSFKRIADPKLMSAHFSYFSRLIKGMEEWNSKQKSLAKTNYDLELDGVKVLSKYKIQIKLNKPHLDFNYMLTSINTAPIPMEMIEYYKNDLSRAAFGTGAFVLKKEIKNHRLEFERNNHYDHMYFPDHGAKKYKGVIKKFSGKRLPFLNSITTHISKEAQTTWLNFLKGHIDYIEVEKDNYGDVFDGSIMNKDFKEKGIVAGKDNGLGNIFYFGFNNKKDPLRSRDLRKAISKAFDYHKFNELFFNGDAQIANSFLPVGIPGNEKNLNRKIFSKDINKAKDLIQKSGVKLRPLRIIVKNKTVSRQVGEFLKRELKQVGINVIVETVSFSDLLKRASKGDYDIFYLSWYVGLPKGLEFFELLYGRNYPGSYNRFGFQNSKFDSLFEKAREARSEKEQRDYVVRLNELAIEEMPFMPLLHSKTAFIHHEKLQNYVPSNLMGGIEKYLTKEY